MARNLRHSEVQQQRTTGAVLSARNLRFSYNGHAVLSGFDLSVNTGEFVGLVGPNGAGKTTLIRLLSGILKQESGTIEIMESTLTDIRPAERARLVSVVPQNPYMPSGMTAWELVLLGRNPHLGLLQWEGKTDADIAYGAMKATSSEKLAHRKIDNLSGGERQRVLIAMALAQQCPVMLLDEPNANLDIVHQPSIMKLLSTLNARNGIAVVVAMHDLTLAAQYCHRIVIVNQGRNFADGEPRHVLTENIIQDVYGTKVHILRHPDTGKPVIVAANTSL